MWILIRFDWQSSYTSYKFEFIKLNFITMIIILINIFFLISREIFLIKKYIKFTKKFKLKKVHWIRGEPNPYNYHTKWLFWHIEFIN